MYSSQIRWGILSTGSIATTFAKTLKAVGEADLVAVASRSLSSAESFAKEHNIAKAYGSYQELAEANDIDVIYIATPHIFHHRDVMMCLKAGKHVLCEKAFTINATEARELVETARSERLFLMEAMWNRYMPLTAKLREILKDETIGRLLRMHGELAFDRSADPRGRLFELELGGGALLDLGIYPLALIFNVMGIPEAISGYAQLGATGADYQSGAHMRFPDGSLGSFYCALNNETTGGAVIDGTKGKIHIHAPLYKPESLTITLATGKVETFHLPCSGTGYEYEAIEVMNCLRAGKLESPLMPLYESVAMMEAMDSLRNQWGLVYPGEK
ncbi:MAG: Gfo/Idh/MocA family protein [Calditrichia bacterium]